MIEQAYVQADDQTTPTIQDIRARISQAVDTTPGPVLDRLAFWLQMPSDSFFQSMMDNDCQVRGKKVAAALTSSADGLYTPSDLSVALDVGKKWTAIDAALVADRAVVVEGSAGHVGGNKSSFKESFHMIVFLAVGQESTGRRFHLGFDPDISATEESRKTWIPFAVGATKAKIERFNDARSIEVIKAMILGNAQDGFGPLVRKYYVETDKAFPKTTY